MPIRSLSKQNNDGIFAPIQLLASTTTMNDPPPDHDVVCSRTPEKGLYEIENVVDVYCIYPFSWFDGIENESEKSCMNLTEAKSLKPALGCLAAIGTMYTE